MKRLSQTLRIALTLVVAAFVAGRTSAQEPPPTPPDVQPQAMPLEIDLDHAAFAYDEGASLLEIYLAIGVASLAFEGDSTGFGARLPLDLTLRRSTDAVLEGTPEEPVWADSVQLAFHVADTSAFEPGQRFVHQLRTSVPPGEYELAVAVPADTASSGAGLGRQRLELRRDVVVPDFGGERVALSDVTLATAIQRSDDGEGPFYKNGLVISPSADQLYGAGLDDLYYYAEAYNASAIAEDGHYTVYAYVAEANRPQPLPGLEQRNRREARSPDVLVGQFDVSGLPSGSYFLRLALLSEGNEAAVEQARKFFVYNPDVQVAAAGGEGDFETSPYASMPADEVAQALEHVQPIATTQERRRAERIRDLDEQRRFLRAFWQKRDADPATPANAFKDEFYRRLQYANERYSSRSGEGWQTDRGRVLLKYGPPATVEPHLFDRGMAPHEIWVYNNIPGEGQASFVFADRDQLGTFELLHATVAGERKMADWQRELRR